MVLKTNSQRNVKLLIHAANLHGLGARNVGRAIIQALYARHMNLPITIIVPDADYLDRKALPGNVNLIFKPKSRAPRSLSRVFDVMCGYRNLLGEYSHVFVLGDIPLVTNIPQWVLVHQPNLVEECVAQSALRKVYYALIRGVFKRNAGQCTGFFVQSGEMERALLERFPMVKGRTHAIPHTIPSKSNGIGTVPEKIRKHKEMGRFLLFYPCGGYPHKNHSLVSRINRLALSIGINDFVIGLTLMEEEVKRIPGLSGALSTRGSILVNLGRLSYSDVSATLDYCDGVFFPSLLESYGLPLVEAMKQGKYVIASNLPYARWMCESEGIYFDPHSEKAAMIAIEQAMDRMRKNIPPNWMGPMAKIPGDWNEVVDRYVGIMGIDQRERE